MWWGVGVLSGWVEWTQRVEPGTQPSFLPARTRGVCPETACLSDGIAGHREELRDAIVIALARKRGTGEGRVGTQVTWS